MSRNLRLMKIRDKLINEYYDKMVAKQFNGKQLYRHTAILAMASEKFFLAEKYIERILSGNNESDKEPVDPNQISIFDELARNEEQIDKLILAREKLNDQSKK